MSHLAPKSLQKKLLSSAIIVTINKCTINMWYQWASVASCMSVLTLQMPVVWKLLNRRLPVHNIFVDWCTIYSYFTSNANRWALGRMFSCIKYKHFVQVSSNQKHICIMWFDVQRGRRAFQSNHSLFCLQPRTRFAECGNKIGLL